MGAGPARASPFAKELRPGRPEATTLRIRGSVSPWVPPPWAGGGWGRGEVRRGATRGTRALPTVIAVRPAVVASSPAVIAGNPAVVAGNPAIVAGNPAIVAGNPAVVASNPAIVAGNPAIVASNPAIVAGNPAIVAGNPAIVAGNPAIVAGNPAIVAGNPAIVAGNPAIVAGNPADVAGSTAVVVGLTFGSLAIASRPPSSLPPDPTSSRPGGRDPWRDDASNPEGCGFRPEGPQFLSEGRSPGRTRAHTLSFSGKAGRSYRGSTPLLSSPHPHPPPRPGGRDPWRDDAANPQGCGFRPEGP